MSNSTSPAGWYQDPTGQGDARYWNGASWTESVDRGGATVNVPIDPSQALVPPLAGTQVSIPSPASGNQSVNVTSNRRSPVGAIIGGVFVVLAIVAILVIVSNNDSSDDTPTTSEPATDAPADGDSTDAPADGG